MDIDKPMIEEIIRKVKNLTHDQQKEILEILNSWQKGRQREYQRLHTRASADVLVGDRIYQTDTKDLSAGGVYINATGKFELGQGLRIVFSISDKEKPFKLKGRIVRVGPKGFAAKFEDVTPYFQKILDDLIWETQSASDDLS